MSALPAEERVQNISSASLFELIYEIEPNDYFLKEIDERVIKKKL